ncbi:hypothetical protein [Burkholderia sp. BE17]|uniref:hypothetical protein n=1 Tax=Burkholderia sp. BE17 TaxID=2656644 RepID=UPI00128BC3CB|nr:hypothetical protein [Burkholderia sp. BE17]MPV67517.1 hypothetical protein [Burkholderia sp. BE17]
MMHLLYGGTETSSRHGRRVSRRPLRRRWLGGYDELAVFGRNQTLLLATLLDRPIAIATGTIPQDLRITHSLWIARGDYQTL